MLYPDMQILLFDIWNVFKEFQKLDNIKCQPTEGHAHTHNETFKKRTVDDVQCS